MQTQRCQKCGQEWWDAHACRLQLTAAQAPIGTRRIEFSTPLQRADCLAKNMPAPMESCGCVGPQNGQPLCPCAMRGVIVRDGRYIVPERDLGPAA